MRLVALVSFARWSLPIWLLATAPGSPAWRPVGAPTAPRSAATTALLAPRAIDARRIEADMRFLSDDLLEGRATGTRGYDIAARYVATRMASIGLEPADGKGFLEPVPFRRASLIENQTYLQLVNDGIATTLTPAVDYMSSGDFTRPDVATDAGLVFVGYGVSAPELGYDDYASVDVRGKIVVTMRGAPPSFPHNQRAYHSNGLVKDAAAASRGAIGTLSFQKPKEELTSPWDRSVRQSRLPSFRWTDERGEPANVQPSLEVGASLSLAGAEKVLAGGPKPFAQVIADADSSRPNSFPLPQSARSRRITRHAAVMSPNVVGLLRGSDPKLANECIVVSAHLDHLGISEPVNGDSINNGAYDNASGIAMMLEVARALTQLSTRPKRSVLFLAVTAEEKGLQGSDYFARHPAPAGLTVVGNYNLDMVLLLVPLKAVIAFGGEHSTLGPRLEAAAKLVNLAVVPDPVPEEVIFVRSDQFSFVKQGVPGIFPVSAGDGTPEYAAKSTEWRRDHYHSPSDDMGQSFDWDGAARFTRMSAITIAGLANDAAPPKWNPGDYFGEKFGKRPATLPSAP